MTQEQFNLYIEKCPNGFFLSFPLAQNQWMKDAFDQGNIPYRIEQNYFTGEDCISVRSIDIVPYISW